MDKETETGILRSKEEIQERVAEINGEIKRNTISTAGMGKVVGNEKLEILKSKRTEWAWLRGEEAEIDQIY